MKTKVSIVVPFHWMLNWQAYLNRCLSSIEKQSFKDYEVILMKVGSMPVTTNRVMEAAEGELIKILYMDDYFSHGESLREIVENFSEEDHWLVTGCLHHESSGEHVGNYHSPSLEGIKEGIKSPNARNTIGSPSVLCIKRESALKFDENLSWLLDLDLYCKLLYEYGAPKMLDTPNVTIGLHRGQVTNTMTQEEKDKEREYLTDKYKDK